MLPETTTKVANNAITKGDVLAAARIAGIQAAKRTAELIPMCHPVLVGSIGVNFSIGDDYVEVEAQVETVDRTGVEMEAMTACAVAALTVYDMCKSADRTMTVEHLALWEKSGGRSGPWRRPEVEPPLVLLRLARADLRPPFGDPPGPPAPPPGLHSVPVTQLEEAPAVGKGIVGAVTSEVGRIGGRNVVIAAVARHHAARRHHPRRRGAAGRGGRPGP